jgi:hypothetical protein
MTTASSDALYEGVSRGPDTGRRPSPWRALGSSSKSAGETVEPYGATHSLIHSDSHTPQIDEARQQLTRCRASPICGVCELPSESVSELLREVPRAHLLTWASTLVPETGAARTRPQCGECPDRTADSTAGAFPYPAIHPLRRRRSARRPRRTRSAPSPPPHPPAASRRGVPGWRRSRALPKCWGTDATP